MNDRNDTVGTEDEAIIDLTHGVSLDIRQFEATRSADRPEYEYVDHTSEFTSADSYGIHIPEAVMYSGREFPKTTEAKDAALNVDHGWLRRIVPFKR